MSCSQSLFIVKALDNRDHVDNLSSGKLILRHYHYYSSSESEGHYGTEFERNNDTLVEDAFIFCAHKKLPSKTPGKYYVKITNPCELYCEINNILKPIIKISGAYFAEVQYFKTESISTALNSLCEPYIEIPYPRTLAFSKENEYSHANEVRMCFFYNEEKIAEYSKLKNCKFNFFKKIFSRNPKIIMIDTFEEWITMRRKTEDYNRDYWIEVEVNVNPKYFHVL